MPNINELVDFIAFALSGNTTDLIWFSDIDLKYSFSQMSFSEVTSPQG